jgi:hypothetical protein
MQITTSTNSLFSTSAKDSLLSKDKEENSISSFDSLIEKENDKEDNVKIENNEREALVKDILSLLKTGFTEDELEKIKELLDKLENLKKKKSSDGNLSLSEIESTLKDIKTTLIQAQEKVTGRSIRNTNENLNNTFPIKKEIEEKINGLKETFTNNKNGTSVKENQILSLSVADQLKLMEQLKQKNRV